MKRIFSCIIIIAAFIIAPMTSSAFRYIVPTPSYTDEELDYQGSRDGDFAHPVSLEPTFLKGILSESGMIANTFFFDLGNVTFQITNEAGQVCLTQHFNATAGSICNLDLKNLGLGKYNVTCFISNERPQVASFEIVE